MNEILKNKKILLTRSEEQSKSAAELFINLGADVILFPTIKIIPTEDIFSLEKIVRDFKQVDILIFTSANAVKYFNKFLTVKKIILNYADCKVIATGNATSDKCFEQGIPVNIVPSEYSAKGILEKLVDYDLKSKNILIPCSSIAREELQNGLIDLGANVFSIPVYSVTTSDEEELKEQIELLKKNKPDIFVFTSPSTFNNFISILKITEPEKYFSDATIAVIGPTTRDSLLNKNVKVDIMPPQYNFESLVNAIAWYSQVKNS